MFEVRPIGLRWLALLPAWVRRRWRELLAWREKIRISEDAVHLLLAAGVGMMGGLVNVALHWGADLLNWAWLGGEADPSRLAGALPAWNRLLLPAGGALAAGLILHWTSRIARLPESANLLEVVVIGDGRLRFRSAVSKTLSSLVSISSGGSIGREGPIVHLSATLASQAGQQAGWEPYRLRLLTACGAAAGLAAAYSAPIGGAVFAAQILLGTFAMNLFAPLVVASVVAAVVSHGFFGVGPWYSVPTQLEVTGVQQLVWFALLGVLAGGMGSGFLRLLEVVRHRLQRAIPRIWIRLGVAGLMVGVIAAWRPEVWGNGYGPTNGILHEQFGLQALAILLLAKLAATLLTVGSGAVGGVFTPTLFLGAGLGAIFGTGLHYYNLADNLPVAAFALVGMGGMLAATIHSPLLAVIMVFEISLNHTLISPLLVTCAVATLAARRFHRESVYTEALRERGIQLERESAAPGSATQQTIGDILRKPVPPVRDTTRFRELAERFLASAYNHLPVVDAEGRLIGVVALHDLKEHLNAGEELDGVIAFDVMRPPPVVLTPDQRIVDAVSVLLGSEQRNIPVVNTRVEMRLVGAVARAEALGLLTEAIASQSRRT